ncbi:MAG TPA: lanthionine synthetase LanC family protein [Streptosporangiaceae bacterium]|nr:lanthionine synthetase LanC family protein [Streptosporangiaceae bacterium]
MADRPDGTDAVRRAFDWIGSVAVEVDGGVGWHENGVLVDDLYSGAAGVLLGCAEATANGLDAAQVAAGARARLVHLAQRGPSVATLPDDGLFSGWAGVAVALRAWSRAGADRAAGEAATRVTTQIARRALQSSADPSRYIDVISGDAGILLALLADESDTALRAVDVLAGRLVEIAEPAPGGLHWRIAAGWASLMPGFSHGTAGVAYALAVAGRALGRPDLVDVASRGALALLSIGDHPDGWAVPVRMPPGLHGAAVSYGWCHGPAGTMRLFTLLNELDPQPQWRDAIDACLQALRDSRIPLRLYPGYWDNLARCCGTAGVGQVLLDRYQASGDMALLDWTEALAADVVDRAITTPSGVTWSNTEHTASPPELPPEPGFMQGAAGIAGWLARLHALRVGSATAVPLTGLNPPWC